MTRSFSVYCLVASLALNMPNAWAQSKSKVPSKSPPKTAKPTPPIKRKPSGAELMQALEDDKIVVALDLIRRGADPNAYKEGTSVNALGFAALSGNLELVKALVEHGAMVNPETPKIAPPLTMVDGKDAAAIMQYLIDKGASVAVYNDGYSVHNPLITAALLGSLPLVQTMLDKGADLNAKSDDGASVLAAAAASGSVPILELLISRGADVKTDTYIVQYAVGSGSIPTLDFVAQQGRPLSGEKSPEDTPFLHLAIASGKPAMIERVLQDTKEKIDDVDEDGMTPLMIAASLRESESVKFLLSKSVDANALNHDYQSVLDIALQEKLGEDPASLAMKQTVAVLRAAGAKPAPPSLCHAVVTGDKEELSSLLASGADPNEPDAFRAVPLYYAISRRSELATKDGVAVLLAKGANPNAQAPDGRTLVTVAREEENKEAVILLRRAGAEVPELELTEAVLSGDTTTINALLEKGIVPEPGALICAMATEDNLELFKRLLDKGAKINAPARLSAAGIPFSGGDSAFPLNAAVTTGNIAAAKLLLERGADPNIHDKAGKTPLQCVYAPTEDNALESDPEITDTLVRLLVEHGADIHASHNAGRDGESPFEWMVSIAPLKTLRYLLDKGAKSEINYRKNDSTSTPLQSAVRRGDPDIVRFLLENGATPDTPPRNDSDGTVLMETVRSEETPKDVEIVRLLVKYGANLDATNERGENALQLAEDAGNFEIAKVLRDAGSKKATIAPAAAMSQAIYRDDIDTVRRLLREGFDPNGTLPDNSLPLYEAAFRGDEEIARLLLERGADVNAKTSQGMPLHGAASMGEVEVVRLLIARGAKVDVEDGFTGTPLARAAENGETETVRVLLKAGADPSARHSEFPGAPLLGAVGKGEAEAIDLLLKAGADVKVPGLLNITLWLDNFELMERLVRAGADINAQTLDGRTVLMDAAVLGNKKYVAWLIAHKADVHTKDKAGKTALSEAIDRDKPGCVELLRKAGAK